MNYFETADWLVIIVYLVGIIGMGLWFGRNQKNTKDYFLGSRNMPWWGVGFSIIATETSALTFIGAPAMAYGVDSLTFIQIIIGYVIARIILAIVMVPHYFKGEIYSAYQLFENAFGPGARRMASIIFLIAAVLGAGVRIYVTCIPLQLILGFSSRQIPWVIVLFVVLSLTYTLVGGVKSAIWVEALQFLLFLGGGVFTLFYIPTLIDGGWSATMHIAQEGGKLHWFNPAFALSKPFNIWMGIIGGTFVVLSSHGVDQLIVQRVLTCKSVADGRKALLLSGVIILPLFLIFLLCGAMLWAYYQMHAIPIDFPKAKTDYVFPVFIVTAIPKVLKGLLIVGILSAAMSSVTAALSALSSVSTMDLFKGISKKQHSERFLMKFSRSSMLFWAVLLIAVAIVSSLQVESALNAALGLSGWTNGAMLGGLILVVWWRRGSPWPMIIGMATAVIVTVYIANFFTWQTGVDAAGEPIMARVAWPWFTLIGTIVTLVVASLIRPFLKSKEAVAMANPDSVASQKL